MTPAMAFSRVSCRRTHRSAAFAALAALIIALPASASTIVFNTFGPGDSFDTVTPGWNVGHPAGYIHAMRFRAQSSGYLDQVTIPLLVASGDFFTGQFAVSISVRADQPIEGEFPEPGAVLESASWSMYQPLGNEWVTAMVTVDMPGTTHVQTGGFYWLVVGPLNDDRQNPGDDITGNWFMNDQGRTGLTSRIGVPSYPGTWYTLANSRLSAFRITASEVPVPAAGWLMMTAFAGLAAGARRRRMV